MNICGVTTVGIGIASCASRSAVSTWVSISSIAVSILRCDDAVTRPRVAATLLAVSNVPKVVAMMGSRWPSPATSVAIDGCSSSPPLRMMHDSDGKPSAAWALTTASTTSERSPGVMTATPSVSRSSTCSAVMPATSTSITSRLSSSGSPLTTVPSTARCEVADRRRDQQRLLGQDIRLRREALQRFGDRGHLRRVTPVGHHRRGVGVLAGDLDQAQLDDLGDLVGVRSLALTASTTGAPRLAAMRALVSSSLGVVTSV